MTKNSADKTLRDTLWQAVMKAREAGVSEEGITLAIASALVRQKADPRGMI